MKKKDQTVLLDLQIVLFCFPKRSLKSDNYVKYWNYFNVGH